LQLIRLFEWQAADFTKHQKEMPEFVSYLNEVWANRNKYVEIDSSEEEKKKTNIQRFFTFTGDRKIIARNYVGVIQFGDIRIEVYPKIFSDEPSKDFSRYQHNLFYWLSYCRKIRFPYSLVDLSKQDIDGYLELLIYIFGNYVNEILSSQPFQAYQEITEETQYLRGRLDFQNYLRDNLIPGKWQGFHCTHTPYVYDNLFNRIVKYVANHLIHFTTNSINRENLSSILFLLHDVTDCHVTSADCEKVKLNPLYSELNNVVNLCKLFLSNQLIDVNFENTRNFCFLIPMEYVFEDFIFGFVSDHWPSLQFISQSQDYLAKNNSREVFQIRNDLYLKDKLIIDTKYKVRAIKKDAKAGVSQNDLYQMIAYSLRRDCVSSLLLYPSTVSSDISPTTFFFPQGKLSQELKIDIRSIDIRISKHEKPDKTVKTRFADVNPIFGATKIQTS
jgi:5-methylcytosine-specific restriction enzyme subunit McrC